MGTIRTIGTVTILTIGRITGTVIIPAIGIMDTTTVTGDMSITTDIIGS
jgi:hypothetical protein